MITRVKLLLAITPERVTVAIWRTGRLVQRLAVPNSHEGRAACLPVLAEYHGMPVYILLDTAREDYRTELLPHAHGQARLEMVTRKLRQHYGPTSYCAAVRRARERSGRRDDRYQFAACTDPALPDGWVALIEQLRLPLAGVFLLPAVCESLVRRLPGSATNVLLLARSHAGLRSMYFRGRHFELGRLNPLPTGNPEQRAAAYAAEVANARLYLDAMQTATVDEPLVVALLDPFDEEVDAFRMLAASHPELACLHINHALVAQALKTKGADTRDTRQGPDSVFLHLLALRTPSLNLAPAAALEPIRHQRFGRSIYVSAALVAALGSAFGGYCWWRIGATEDALAILNEDRTLLHERAARQQHNVPDGTSPPVFASEVVNAATEIRKSARAPERAMTAVARALTRTPEILLHELTWKSAAPADEQGVVKIAADETVELACEVRLPPAEYRVALSSIRAFAEALSRDNDISVARLTRMPPDADPAATVSGNTSEAITGHTRFAVLVTFKRR